MWSPAKKRWLLSMDGVEGHAPPRVASSARRRWSCSTSTVKPSVYHDVNGANTPQTQTVGKGKALFFRDGQVFEGAWSRPSKAGATTYTIAAAAGRRSPRASSGSPCSAAARPVTG